MAKKKYNVAIVGATGVVGKEMLAVLAERKFPIDKLIPLASERTAGTSVEYLGKKYKVELTTNKSFEGVDIALFSAGAKISEMFAPAAVKAGAVVIDNTSHFRMDPKVPLVVPEVNAKDIKKHKGIIANPNCSTAQMVLVLKPIYDAVGIKRVVVSTYQSVSGAGKEAIDELLYETKNIMNCVIGNTDKKVMAHQIAFNLIPQIDSFLPNGYTKEEIKMVNETKKIMGDNKIEVTATCIRVPVFVGHSESVNIETKKKISADQARKLFSKFPNLVVVDKPEKKIYPMPIDCVGKNDTFVGRIREDISVKNGLDLWVVSDNLRKGAAFNAVQIAEELVKQKLI
ncbi:MAG: aspartate-semialdehyde dehydrogenase [Candidatus Margulisiibacteriota bacterium]